MAGIEVAGLVLGGFSLVISAMEHYGTMEKMSRTWWKLKREHKKDLGRLRDCELMYRANIRTLLAPLELDGTIDSLQLETLLADLGDNGWQNDDVDAVLVRRLGERKERYFENLREMNSIIMKLAKVSMALDREFQRSLERGTQTSQTPDPVAHAAHRMLLRANANLKFEVKRVGYTLSMYKREALLNDIERCNNTLKDFLSVQDSAQDDQLFGSRTATKRISQRYKPLLAFWRHADCMHRLMQIAWRCTCSPYHCVSIQLCQTSESAKVCLDMTVKFRDRTTTPQAQHWEEMPVHVARRKLTALSHTSNIQVDGSPAWVTFDLPDELIWQNASTRPGNSSASVSAGPENLGPLAAPKHSLCRLAERSQALQAGACICTLDNDTSDDIYGIFRARQQPKVDHVHCLSDILAHKCAFDLLYMHRLLLAYNITRSFLKLGATPWLDAGALSTSIYLPVAPDGQTMLHKQAFVLSQFHSANDAQPSDETFILLGILLLELCFNKTLEQHPQWQAWQKIPGLIIDPVLRLAVATTWARTAEDVWSTDGAKAINWCLHCARSQNDKWREEFASNVVEPLGNLCQNAGLDIDKRPD